MFIFKSHESDELTDMKVSAEKSTLLDWVIDNYPAGTDSYDDNNITYVRLNQKEIGVIAPVEVVN